MSPLSGYRLSALITLGVGLSALVVALVALRRGRWAAKPLTVAALLLVAQLAAILLFGARLVPVSMRLVLAAAVALLLAGSATLYFGRRSASGPADGRATRAPDTAPATRTRGRPRAAPPGTKARSEPTGPARSDMPLERRIFLSYRREDAPFVVGRLHDRLTAHFGAGAVFKDVDSIPPGVNFRTFIQDEIAASEVVLAVIGEGWLGAGAPDGRARIEQESDFVRIELASARRLGVPIIPVLVRDAPEPRREALPSDLAELADIQVARLRSDPDFHGDVDRLIDAIERLMAGPRA